MGMGAATIEPRFSFVVFSCRGSLRRWFLSRFLVDRIESLSKRRNEGQHRPRRHKFPRGGERPTHELHRYPLAMVLVDLTATSVLAAESTSQRELCGEYLFHLVNCWGSKLAQALVPSHMPRLGIAPSVILHTRLSLHLTSIASRLRTTMWSAQVTARVG